MELIYRRRVHEDIWHCAQDCPEWPTKGEYFEQKSTPDPRDLCVQCRELLALRIKADFEKAS